MPIFSSQILFEINIIVPYIRDVFQGNSNKKLVQRLSVPKLFGDDLILVFVALQKQL